VGGQTPLLSLNIHIRPSNTPVPSRVVWSQAGHRASHTLNALTAGRPPRMVDHGSDPVFPGKSLRTSLQRCFLYERLSCRITDLCPWEIIKNIHPEWTFRFPRDVHDRGTLAIGHCQLVKKTSPRTLFMLMVGLGNNIEAGKDDDTKDEEMHDTNHTMTVSERKTSFPRDEIRQARVGRELGERGL